MRPWKRGFHESFGFLGGGHHYFQSALTLDTGEYNIGLHRNEELVKLERYLTDVISDGAADFIRRHRTQPWFLYTAYNAPHTPQHATDECLRKFESIADPRRRASAAMISCMDDGVGRILKAVDETGAARNTLVVFLSANGGPIAVNGSSNGILRGAKGQLHEGGIRTPLAMRWPARLKAGAVYEQLMSPARSGARPTSASSGAPAAAPPTPSPPRIRARRMERSAQTAALQESAAGGQE